MKPYQVLLGIAITWLLFMAMTSRSVSEGFKDDGDDAPYPKPTSTCGSTTGFTRFCMDANGRSIIH